MDLYLALRLAAMQAVTEGKSEYSLRRIRRWYSERFHTPLADAEDIEDEVILQHYFEVHFEEMTEEERQDEIKELLETPEEKTHKARKKDIEDAEMFEFAKFTEEQQKKEAKKLSEVKAAEKESLLKSNSPKESQFKSPVKNTSQLPENITVSFLGADDFEKELERLSLEDNKSKAK